MKTNNFLKYILTTYNLKIPDILEMSRHIHEVPISRATIYRAINNKSNIDTNFDNLIKIDDCLSIMTNGSCQSIVKIAIDDRKRKLGKLGQ